MVYINEWLPNPQGLDTANEWVELWNGGPEAVNLGGWILVTKGGAKAKLSGEIGADEYLLLRRPATKLVLRNTDESLSLYDGAGRLADQSSFLGSAPEGKSFGRMNYNDHNHNNDNRMQDFAWSEPTPGAANKISLDASVVKNEYPLNQPLNRQLGGWEFFGLMVGAAAVLAGLVIFIIKKNEDLSKLFFGGDEAIR